MLVTSSKIRQSIKNSRIHIYASQLVLIFEITSFLIRCLKKRSKLFSYRNAQKYFIFLYWIVIHNYYEWTSFCQQYTGQYWKSELRTHFWKLNWHYLLIGIYIKPVNSKLMITKLLLHSRLFPSEKLSTSFAHAMRCLVRGLSIRESNSVHQNIGTR